MIEIQKLIEYSNLAGFSMYTKGENLMVKNGGKLPFHLKEQIQIHKDDIMKLLNERSD